MSGVHATLSPSSSERWITCPGSIALSEGLSNSSSVYAREGTAAHDLAERSLRRNLPPETWLGETFIIEGEPFEITEEMVEAVSVYVEYVRSLRGPAYCIEGIEYLEQRFTLAALNPPVPMFGTADFVLWEPSVRVLRVIDYKHGQGVAVEVQDNPQTMYYALGAVLKLSTVPKRIITTIVQPRCSHDAGAIRSAEYTWADLVKFSRELMAAAQRTQEADAPLVAGEHCRFCPALAVCPAQYQLVQQVAQTEFTTVVAEPAELPAPEQLTEEQLQLALHYADTIEEWLGAVRACAQAKLERGEQVDGWKLVDKRAVRRWIDETEAEAAIASVLSEGAYTRKLLSPAQAEKALKAVSMKLPAELVEKVSSGKKLARANDPRPAQLPSATTDFIAED